VIAGTAFLEGEQLLGAEALVVDLRCGFNEVLEVGASEKVAKVDEFAMVLVLDYQMSACISASVRLDITIDDAPAVLAAADLLACNDNRLLGTYNGKWNEILNPVSRAK
jgi:hypothetical protein